MGLSASRLILRWVVIVAALLGLATTVTARAEPDPAPTPPPKPAGEKSDPVVFLVAGLRTDSLKLRADNEVTQWTIALATTAGQAIATQVNVAAFRNESRGMFTPTLRVGGADKGQQFSINLEAGKPAGLEIDVNLPELGEYTSELTLSHDKTEKVVKLTVVREIPASSFELLPPAAAVGEGTCDARVALGVSIRELNGKKKVLLAPPELTNLTVKGAPGAVQAAAKVTPKWECPAGEKDKDKDDRIAQLGPAQTCQGVLTVSSLAGAGEYTGTLRLSEVGKAPVEKPVTLYVHAPRSLALFCILLGALASIAARSFANRGRPRLLSLKQCAEQIEHYRGLMADLRDARERDLVSDIISDLERLRARIANDGIAGTEAKLAAFSGRQIALGAWLKAYRLVIELQPETLRGPFMLRLGAAEATLRDEAATADALDAAAKDLAKIPVDATNEVKTLLTAQIAQERQVSAPDSAPDVRRSLDETVAPHLDNAEKLIQKNDLNAAVRAYEEARRLRLHIFIDHLRSALNAPPPPHMTPEEWALATTTVRKALDDAAPAADVDPAAAFRAYDYARAELLRAKLTALHAAARLENGALDDDENLDPAVKAEKQKLLQRVVELTEAGQDLRRQGQLDSAADKLDAAAASYHEASQTGATKTRSAAAAPALAALADAPRSTVGGETVKAGRSLQTEIVLKDALSSDTLRARIVLGDRALTMVALVAALALGDLALFENDASWGGVGKCIIALLWGLGLHQFSFQGLSGLSTAISGLKETP